MAALPETARRYTVEEFRDLVEHSEEKYEYFEGLVYEWQFMAGTSDPHSRIASNFQRRFETAAEERGSPCVSLNSDAYVAIPRNRIYRLPDATIQCDEPVYDEDFGFARTNPRALVEVVSESSRRADYGEKFKQYSRFDSLREYVLFERETPLCIVYSRPDAKAPWTTTPYSDLDDEVTFPSMGIRIRLALFYKDLVWTPEGVRLVPGSGTPEDAGGGRTVELVRRSDVGSQ